ncbi:MAG: hypothetical protein QOH82_2849 [Mycobacterium sp.]|nr:hypothetical protein [Mycobacterium sp.]
MTTPPTPADWYPDPEDPTGLRYWDGTGWTEHRAPAVAPPAPEETPAAETPAETPIAPADESPASEQATSVVPLPDQSTNVFSTRPAEPEPEPETPLGGAHRAADAQQQEPSQPYDTHPPTSYEPPSHDPAPWDAPLPPWDAPSAEQPTYPEQPTYAPPPTQSFEPASFTSPPGPPPGMFQPPTGPSGEGPNKKLVIGILGGAAVILLVIVLVIVFVEIRQNEPSVTSQGSASSETSTASSGTSTKSSSASSTAESPTLTPPPTGAEGSDGDYTFSVAGTETGDTITSNVSDAVQTTADGMFYVVYVNVSNTGTSPLTFVATFQQLSAAGQTFPLDDEATAFLGGTIAEVAPGDKVETPLVFDIPVGTTPDTILLRADPASPGVQLPLR